MKIKQAKEYFHDGMVTGFYAVRDPLAASCWLMVIEGHGGKSWTLQTALGEPKSFASVDTLLGQIEDISGPVSSFRVNAR